MAETAVSLAGQHLLPKFLEAVNMLKDLPNEVADFTDELENFQHFINGADKVAEAEEDDSRRDRIKKRVMRLREASFRMEDIIDEYMICEEKQPDDLGCAALPCEAVDFIKTLIHRIQIAYKIHEVKTIVHKERDGFKRVFPVEETPNKSRGNQHVTWDRLRMAPLYTEEDRVVGFDGPKDKLEDWLIKGKSELTVIYVVGMGGQGKTTLAKMVFDSKEVFRSFDCHAWITVSQFYTVEQLLGNMLRKFGKGEMNVSTMDRLSLIDEVRDHLRRKRYVIFFDDVWDKKFWHEIEFALIDNKNGSRILITTRNEEVAQFCNISSIQVYKLELLKEEESMRLFCKKAFQFGSDGCCPHELRDISLEIVRKCKGLPLAIVVISGLLSQKDKSALEWRLCTQNLSVALERNSEFSIAKILSLSYDDLPNNLKSCLLYFGMYPEDCEVKSNRLIRQWIAEGFIKLEEGKTLEEVAQQYLDKLILRNLVQVCSFTIDGKAKRCRVHDLLHEMILKKIKDTAFGLYFGDPNQSISSEIVRRLTIAADSEELFGSIDGSFVRSIQIILNRNVSEHLLRRIPTKFMFLKVLDSASISFKYVPKNLGNLIYLKYLRFTGSSRILPKSIGNLQNLETLDAKDADFSIVPKEIIKLRKLRHLLVSRFASFEEVKDSLGGMTSLEVLHTLIIDDNGVMIRELAKLNKLRDLRLDCLMKEDGRTLGSSINEMQFLEKLHIHATDHQEVVDLHNVSPKFTLRKLSVNGKLEKLPNWIPELKNLVKLTLCFSFLTDDPMKSLKDMPNLLLLCMRYDAYDGKSLHFEDGGFQTLKKLRLEYLNNLKSIIIRRALRSLERLELCVLTNLKRVSGIQYLEKLRVVKTVPREIQDKIYAYMENNSGGSSSNCKIDEM